MVLWIKALHIIAMVAWFSGLFYLPRLFVYHALANDMISVERFKLMEKKLYYYIMTPAAVLTLLFGVWLISFSPQTYMQMLWLHIKLGLVGCLILYHLYLAKLLYDFSLDRNKHSAKFYRIINELPTLFLFAIVILAVVKPFGMISY